MTMTMMPKDAVRRPGPGERERAGSKKKKSKAAPPVERVRPLSDAEKAEMQALLERDRRFEEHEKKFGDTARMKQRMGIST
jgi:hypothetical protein